MLAEEHRVTKAGFPIHVLAIATLVVGPVCVLSCWCISFVGWERVLEGRFNHLEVGIYSSRMHNTRSRARACHRICHVNLWLLHSGDILIDTARIPFVWCYCSWKNLKKRYCLPISVGRSHIGGWIFRTNNLLQDSDFTIYWGLRLAPDSSMAWQTKYQKQLECRPRVLGLV